MAASASVLFLPPPALRQAGVPAHSRGPGNAASEWNPLSDEARAGDARTGDARARHFRFRVYDNVGKDVGSGRDEPAGAGNESARSTHPTADRARAYSRPESGRPEIERAESSEPKALATFLAQMIAQERLAPGLHHPPIAKADIAYRRAGAEPPLADGTATASPVMPLVRLSV